MFYALSWLAVLSLLALWSLAVWALHAAAVWVVANAGALSGSTSGVGAITVPEWLAPWLPADMTQPVVQLIEGFGPLVSSLLQAAPALAGGLTVVAWVSWAIGAGLLLLLGAGLHLLIALWRRRGGGGSGPSAGAAMAAG